MPVDSSRHILIEVLAARFIYVPLHLSPPLSRLLRGAFGTTLRIFFFDNHRKKNPATATQREAGEGGGAKMNTRWRWLTSLRNVKSCVCLPIAPPTVYSPRGRLWDVVALRVKLFFFFASAAYLLPAPFFFGVISLQRRQMQSLPSTAAAAAAAATATAIGSSADAPFHPFGPGLPIRELCDLCCRWMDATTLLALRLVSRRHRVWTEEGASDAWRALLEAELAEGWRAAETAWRSEPPAWDVGAVFLFATDTPAGWENPKKRMGGMHARMMRECIEKLRDDVASARRSSTPSIDACASALCDAVGGRAFDAYWTAVAIALPRCMAPDDGADNLLPQEPRCLVRDVMGRAYLTSGKSGALIPATIEDEREARCELERPAAVQIWETLESCGPPGAAPSMSREYALDEIVFMLSGERDVRQSSTLWMRPPCWQTFPPPWVPRGSEVHAKLERALQAGWRSYRSRALQEGATMCAYNNEEMSMTFEDGGAATGVLPDEAGLPLLVLNSMRAAELRAIGRRQDEFRYSDVLACVSASADLVSASAFALSFEAGPGMAYLGEGRGVAVVRCPSRPP
jgi:hypothetical protein